MSSIPPDGQRPDSDVHIDINELVNQIQSQLRLEEMEGDLATRLRSAHAEGELVSRGVRDATAEIITGRQYAPELFERHRSLNKAKEVTVAILLAAKQHREKLREFQRSLPLEGAFFEDESLQHYESILEDPLWVIAHAGGSIRDPQSMKWREPRFVADMQLQLPHDDPAAPLVTSIPLPDDPKAVFHDKVDAKKIAEEIHRNPAIAACINNVGVHPLEYRNFRFGSMTREKIADHLEENINPSRKNPIKYLVANMFNIVGVRLQPQSGILMMKKPIVNKVSILMHALSTKLESLYAWRIRGDDIPVSIPRKSKNPIEAGIVMNWETVIMYLNKRRRVK